MLLAKGSDRDDQAQKPSMLMAAIPESIRSDVVARKCNQSAPALLFRLHTTYQPGRGSEKALILKSLQPLEVAKDPASAVKSLRDWIRWYNRCVDCTFMLRAIRMDAQSTSTAVLEYHKHLLAECEALAVSKPAKATKPLNRWEGRWPSRKASLQVFSRCFGMQTGW